MIQKEQASWKKIETRVLNVCRSGLLLEYTKDSEENETPFQTYEVEYEQKDKLFVTRILSESTMKDLHATFMTSQKLTKGVHRASEAWREPFTPSDYIRGFESVFAKEDFDILLEHRQ